MNLIFRYIKNLGLFKGIGNWLKVELIGGGDVRPKSIRSRVRIRKGTSDKKVFREIFLFRDYDFDLNDPKVIIDAGANVGYTSVFFANKFPEARIIAIEPDADNFAMLKQNIKPYDQIKPILGALGSNEGKLSIKNKDSSEWAYQVESNDEGSIPGITIDSLMKSEDLQKINLLKIDIEGSEKDLFANSTDWLSKVDTIAIELHDQMTPGSSKTFFDSLSEIDYSTRLYGGMVIVDLH